MRDLKSAWSRLQALSCVHNAELYRAGKTRRWRGVSVDPEIQTNVEILGRGVDDEIKARVLWYIDYEPAVFDRCSKNLWELI
jgi:hypothetical protein